jgi:hypothetical protein
LDWKEEIDQRVRETVNELDVVKEVWLTKLDVFGNSYRAVCLEEEDFELNRLKMDGCREILQNHRLVMRRYGGRFHRKNFVEGIEHDDPDLPLCWLKLIHDDEKQLVMRACGNTGPMRLFDLLICGYELKALLVRERNGFFHVMDNMLFGVSGDYELSQLSPWVVLGNRSQMMESTTVGLTGVSYLMKKLCSCLTAVWEKYYGNCDVPEFVNAYGVANEWIMYLGDLVASLVGDVFGFFGRLECMGLTVGHILLDAVTGLFSGLHVGLPFLLPVLKLINYFLQDYDQAHSNAHRWESGHRNPYQVKVLDSIEIEKLCAVNPFPQLEVRNHFFSVDPMMISARNQLRQFSDDNVGQRALMATVSNEIMHAYQNDDRPRLYFGTDVSEGRMVNLQRFFPEFRVRQVSYRHTHSVLTAVRYAYGALIQNFIRQWHQDQPIKVVGGKASQLMRFDNLIHNCGPILSGRDQSRRDRASLPQLERFNQLTSRHLFQDCHCSAENAVVVAEYSTGDMSLDQFIRGMLRCGNKVAYVSIMLPIPMLDKRVDVYRDEVNGVLYEKRDKRILVYNTQAAVAGYDHDYEALMSWVSPVPIYDGLNIKVEELRRLGTNFLLQIEIGKGSQEMQPTIWRVTEDNFYILPLIGPTWKYGESTKRTFVVPASRFDNIVEFISAPGTDKDAYEVLCSRTRSQMAEIKIGNQVVEARWNLSLEEFNSVIGHAILASMIAKWDFNTGLNRWKGYFSRWYARQTDNIINRLRIYYNDLFTLQLAKKKDPFAKGIVAKMLDWYTAIKLDHGHMWNPYSLCGEYRVVHGVTKEPLNLTKVACKEIGMFLFRCKEMDDIAKLKSKTFHFDLDFSSRDYLYGDKFDFKKTLPFMIKIKQKETIGLNLIEDSVVAQTDSQIIQCAELESGIGILNKEESYKDEESIECYQPSVVSSLTKQNMNLIGTSKEVARPNLIERLEIKLKETEDYVRINTEMRSIFKLPENRLADVYTDSVLNFEGNPFQFVVKDTSLCHQKFRAEIQTYGELEEAIEMHKVIYMPDIGGLEIIQTIMRRPLISWWTKSHAFGIAANLARGSKLESSELAKMTKNFFSSVKPTDMAAVPHLLLDGVAGSAKSSLVRLFLQRTRERTVVVTPSRKLREDWARMVNPQHVVVLTKHAAEQQCSLMVIDEVYAIEGEVLLVWLQRAWKMRAKVIVLGERNQQYEHVCRIDPLFFEQDIPTVVIRMMVSNTMPQDSLSLAKEVLSRSDSCFYELAQTRNPRQFSMYWIDDAGPIADKLWSDLEFTETSRTQFVGKSEREIPQAQSMMGISQVQGARAKKVLFHPSMRGTSWLRNTPNLAYVAISRHSEVWLSFYSNDSMELQMFGNLESCSFVDGVKKTYEPFALDMLEQTQFNDKAHLLGNSAESCSINHITLNKIAMDFIPEMIERPDCVTVQEVQDFIFSRSQINSAMRDDLPQHLKAGPGARSFMMHPKIVIRDTARVQLLNADKLAVHQLSANQWDDQRNVDLRQFDQPVQSEWQETTVREAEWLFRKFVSDYCKDEYSLRIHEQKTCSWLNTRSRQFIALLDKPQLFGELGRSCNHLAFLKTQDKVKAKPNYTAQLQYGQTVIASDASYNALMGPFTQKIERQLQKMMRDDFIIDVGYSDRDFSRLLREKGLDKILNQSPCQIDVVRQDASHSAVIVIAFCLLLEWLGFPSDLCEIYLAKRSQYKVHSMASCLYAGLLAFNLPSGDPFTLFANICQMAFVMCERFDMKERKGATKGDDTILDELPRARAGIAIPSLRNVNLEILNNGVAYHAGRFILPNGNLVYDPVRFVMKLLAKGHGKASNEELDIALHDRLIWLDGVSLRYLQMLIPLQYKDCSTLDAILILRIANSLKNGNLYWKLVERDLKIKRKIRFSSDTDCAYELVLWLGHGETIAEMFRYNSGWQVYQLFKKFFPNENVFYGDEIPRKAWLLGGIGITKTHVVFIK